MKVSFNDCFTRLTLLNAIAPAELKDDARLASRVILMRVGYQKAVGEFQEAMQKVAESLNEAPAEGADPMTEEQKEAAFAEARKSKAAETVEVPRAKMDAETFAALTAASPRRVAGTPHRRRLRQGRQRRIPLVGRRGDGGVVELR